MPSQPTIRRERDEDRSAIGRVITAAFAGKPYADGDEAELVDKLRRADALTLSLVAELDGAVVGQVAFSPAGAPAWYALGPVAVLPDHQRAGIGSQLIRAGLARITELGAHGCILVGDPAYYERFGFVLSPEHAPAREPAEYFQLKVLAQEPPNGPIPFHAAFYSVPG